MRPKSPQNRQMRLISQLYLGAELLRGFLTLLPHAPSTLPICDAPAARHTKSAAVVNNLCSEAERLTCDTAAGRKDWGAAGSSVTRPSRVCSSLERAQAGRSCYPAATQPVLLQKGCRLPVTFTQAAVVAELQFVPCRGCVAACQRLSNRTKSQACLPACPAPRGGAASSSMRQHPQVLVSSRCDTSCPIPSQPSLGP